MFQANMRSEKRDLMAPPKEKDESKQQSSSYFDPRVSTKAAPVRRSRQFKFFEKGTFEKQVEM